MNAKDSESKDHSPLRRKSKYDKFHKLFKTVPAEEYPLNDYSCAYIGDILLHGSIYISQNWICFYSKIRARGRRLQIPLEKVISITREKTALVFPNAIGVQTAEEKYTFGSFLMRDNAYKFINTVWKKSQTIKTIQNDHKFDLLKEKTVLNKSVSAPAFSNGTLESGNQFLEEAVEEEDEEEEEEEQEEACLRKENAQERVNCDSDRETLQNTSSFNQNNNLITSDSSDVGPCNLCDNSNGEKQDTAKLCENGKPPTSSVRKDPAAGKGPMIRAVNIPYIFECFEVQKMIAAFSELSSKFQKIPRTNLLLAVCSVMILFLMLSAVALTYKILVLQARIDGKEFWTPMAKQSWSFYDLEASSHVATIRQLHQVLEANLHVLEEMGMNLKSLQATTGKQFSCPTKEEDCKNSKL